MIRVFLIAGEASGDRLGAALMAGLKSLTDVEFHGIGGLMMAQQGLTSLFEMEELSLMGLVEVLPKYLPLKRRIRQTVAAVQKARPDVLITIDSPGFCLRVARQVKAKSNVRTVHYVAPSVWAWRPKRAGKMAQYIDQVLALLPFEPPLMRAAGMRCDFVGHPVMAEPPPTAGQINEFKQKYTIGNAPVLLLLPGSRRSEVVRLAPIFGKALNPVLARHPDIRVVIPTTSSVTGLVKKAVENWAATPLILDPSEMSYETYLTEKTSVFHLASWALAASGSVSLELAKAKTPMLIAYDMNRISRIILSKLLRVDTVTLVNLITQTHAVPECVGKNCKADIISSKLLKLIDNAGGQPEAMAQTVQILAGSGEAPGLRAAKAVLEGLIPPA